jgi:hypothetical protein
MTRIIYSLGHSHSCYYGAITIPHRNYFSDSLDALPCAVASIKPKRKLRLLMTTRNPAGTQKQHRSQTQSCNHACKIAHGYICTCVYARMNTCVHMYVHAWECIHVWTCIHEYIFTCTHASMPDRPAKCAYKHACMHPCMHACMRVRP